MRQLIGSLLMSTILATVEEEEAAFDGNVEQGLSSFTMGLVIGSSIMIFILLLTFFYLCFMAPSARSVAKIEEDLKTREDNRNQRRRLAAQKRYQEQQQRMQYEQYQQSYYQPQQEQHDQPQANAGSAGKV